MKELNRISEAMCNDLRERGYRDNIPINMNTFDYVLTHHAHICQIPTPHIVELWQAMTLCMCLSGKFVDGGIVDQQRVVWMSGE